jgi:hypothetical protein
MPYNLTNYKLLNLTLSLSTSQYADADVLAATQELADALLAPGTHAILQSLVVLDKDDQGAALDLVFFRSEAAMGAAENAALAITDANADEILTVVEIAAADFVDLANSQIATKGPSDAGMSAVLTATSGQSLFVAAISRGTGTYTASGITLKIGLLRSV